MHDPV
jgi:hypothetical protein